MWIAETGHPLSSMRSLFIPDSWLGIRWYENGPKDLVRHFFLP
jgi:hypothetical protein